MKLCNNVFLDGVALISSSGSFIVIEYDPVTNIFAKLHECSFAKSCNTQFSNCMAADPEGHTLIICKKLLIIKN